MKWSKKWFKPVRHSYLPVSIEGALTYIPFISYVFFAIYLPIRFLRPYWLDYLIIMPNMFIAWWLINELAKFKSK